MAKTRLFVTSKGQSNFAFYALTVYFLLILKNNNNI